MLQGLKINFYWKERGFRWGITRSGLRMSFSLAENCVYLFSNKTNFALPSLIVAVPDFLDEFPFLLCSRACLNCLIHHSLQFWDVLNIQTEFDIFDECQKRRGVMSLFRNN